MPEKNKVLNFLEEHEIPFSFEQHDAVLNMAESGFLNLSIIGARCKNLLLQDKKGHYFLVVTTATKALDLLALSKTLTSKRLSFASEGTLLQLLDVRTGSLSPLALINDAAGQVQLVMDSDLDGQEAFLFHPLENNSSVSVSRSALNDFLSCIQHPALWVALAAKQCD